MRYGRTGSAGQTQKKDFPSEEQARAAAAKLIAEKTAKGYVEVAAEPAPAEKPAEATRPAPAEKPAGAKAEVKKPVEAKKGAKAEKKEVPPFTLMNGKSLGARALVNAAERFAAATTREVWQDAATRITYGDHELAKVLNHLFAHGLFTPAHRVHVAQCRTALLTAPPEIALSVLSGLGEPLVETRTTELPIVTDLVPVLARLHATRRRASRCSAGSSGCRSPTRTRPTGSISATTSSARAP